MFIVKLRKVIVYAGSSDNDFHLFHRILIRVKTLGKFNTKMFDYITSPATFYTFRTRLITPSLITTNSFFYFILLCFIFFFFYDAPFNGAILEWPHLVTSKTHRDEREIFAVPERSNLFFPDVKLTFYLWRLLAIINGTNWRKYSHVPYTNVFGHYFFTISLVFLFLLFAV